MMLIFMACQDTAVGMGYRAFMALLGFTVDWNDAEVLIGELGAMWVLSLAIGMEVLLLASWGRFLLEIPNVSCRCRLGETEVANPRDEETALNARL